jgi:hypothetical protein
VTRPGTRRSGIPMAGLLEECVGDLATIEKERKREARNDRLP